jgi:hypothetical protein
MTQIYTIFLSSIGKNVVDNSNLNSVKFYVNWSSILPLNEYKAYSCNVKFISDYTDTSYSLNLGYLSINLGKTNVFDGVSEVNNLSIITTNFLNSTYFNYISTNLLNDDDIVIYPNNENITVNLKNDLGYDIPNMENYIITLTLKPIKN